MFWFRPVLFVLHLVPLDCSCVWFRLVCIILPGYTSTLQIADCRCVWLPSYTSALQIADVFGSSSAPICMHLSGLLRIETSSSTESALWDASLCRMLVMLILVLLVTTRPTTGNTLTWEVACERDQWGCAIAGHVNVAFLDLRVGAFKRMERAH
ncbi:hypothetical protein Tco_0580828 [Tanacetum coccineum]